jgi:hypothetical protein
VRKLQKKAEQAFAAILHLLVLNGERMYWNKEIRKDYQTKSQTKWINLFLLLLKAQSW